MRQTIFFPLFLLAGGALASVAQPEADLSREQRSIDDALDFLPEGETLKIVSSGQAEPMADLLWMRAVLTFGERFGEEGDPRWTAWLARMIDAVTTLDPDWRTPFFWGGMMLRVTGDIDASDEVFENAMERFPIDAFFPFILGMNAWFYREDANVAADYLELAAEDAASCGRLAALVSCQKSGGTCPPAPETPCEGADNCRTQAAENAARSCVATAPPEDAEACIRPYCAHGAPSWYASAAAEMRQKGGSSRAAIRFLEETLATTDNPAIRADTERQLARMRHNVLVESWSEGCKRWKVENGAPLERPEALSKIGFALPKNPRGDAWVVGADGVVRSLGAEAERRRRAVIAERALLAR